jgi:hypothetical protein
MITGSKSLDRYSHGCDHARALASEGIWLDLARRRHDVPEIHTRRLDLDLDEIGWDVS